MLRSRLTRLPRPLLLSGAGLFVVAGAVLADYWSAEPPGIEPTFVGRSACVECHREQADAFVGSDHDLAMELASDQSVLGDFSGATLEHDGITSRMFRDGSRFMVHTEGDDGQLRDFEVKYVLGFEPLQQYMVEFDRAPGMPASEISRLQVLRISWDTRRKRWFYLRPPDVKDKLAPDDPLHWTGIAQRWQTMCADCHSTNLRQNYDAGTLRYHTTFSEIDVSCEACHGPGSLHVELANGKSLFWDRRYKYGLAGLKGEDAEPQLQTCAPCHSRRGVLDAEFRAGESYCDHYQLELLQDETYFADGQIKDEVYEYGSFIQSRMYHKGIRCSDCHDPHSLELKHPGNETCTSCHQHSAGKYDVPAHHHHKPGTPGSMCVDCHMPERTYMDVDARRDHSLRVPRPDLSVQLGTPNACSGCHVADRIESIDPQTRASLQLYQDWQQAAAAGHQAAADAIRATDQWCDEACEKWYGAERKKPPQFSQPIVALRQAIVSGADVEPAIRKMLRLAVMPEDQAPAIARASALGELAAAGAPSRATLATAASLLDEANEHPIVRTAAIQLFLQAPPEAARKTLLPHIDDPSRLVRSEATRALVASGAYRLLTPSEQTRVDLALREVRDALMVAADRAGSHMAWAMLCEGQGRYEEAIDAYETAIAVERGTAGPRSNLASLLEQLAVQASGPQAMQWVTRVAELRAAELPLLRRDAGLLPNNAAIQYRLGLALYLAGEMQEAMQQLERAVELAPTVADFRQARDLLREKLSSDRQP